MTVVTYVLAFVVAAAAIDQVPAADRRPPALQRVGQSAVALFEAVRAADWSEADDSVRRLNGAMADLPGNLPKPDLVAQLRARVDALAQTVGARAQAESMDDANSISKLVVDLSADYEPMVPYEIKMLAYYGRQIELGVTTTNHATVAQAVTDLKADWNRSEPALLQAGHAEAARRFTDIIVRLDEAGTPAEVLAAARAERTAADGLEGLFRTSR